MSNENRKCGMAKWRRSAIESVNNINENENNGNNSNQLMKRKAININNELNKANIEEIM
jgi:hypothetical protein